MAEMQKEHGGSYPLISSSDTWATWTLKECDKSSNQRGSPEGGGRYKSRLFLLPKAGLQLRNDLRGRERKSLELGVRSKF